MKTYYKLVSLNPDRYEQVGFIKAHIAHADYCNYCDTAGVKPKKFKQWLKTEV